MNQSSSQVMIMLSMIIFSMMLSLTLFQSNHITQSVYGLGVLFGLIQIIYILIFKLYYIKTLNYCHLQISLLYLLGNSRLLITILRVTMLLLMTMLMASLSDKMVIVNCCNHKEINTQSKDRCIEHHLGIQYDGLTILIVNKSIYSL